VAAAASWAALSPALLLGPSPWAAALAASKKQWEQELQREQGCEQALLGWLLPRLVQGSLQPAAVLQHSRLLVQLALRSREASLKPVAGAALRFALAPPGSSINESAAPAPATAAAGPAGPRQAGDSSSSSAEATEVQHQQQLLAARLLGLLDQGSSPSAALLELLAAAALSSERQLQELLLAGLLARWVSELAACSGYLFVLPLMCCCAGRLCML
jgi:hypothetical protein